MWLEIHPSSKESSKVFDITPQPVLDYEVRLIIYDTKNLINSEDEGATDAFFKSWIDDKDKLETDTHYRCMDGKASFNYRQVSLIKAPRPEYLQTIQIWDRDLFKSNDFMGEVQLDLKPIFEDVIATQKTMSISKKYYSAFLKNVMP
mmetsp:Transcript_8380/g.7747  ORF Transcript_8380/g.7747 Transcript_8380/m.7747 type:complete len:147 (+) Transcript_8380:1655-2095(+)